MEMSDRKRLSHLVRSTQQHKVLIDLVRKNGWHAGAEIGVLRGKTLFALLEAAPRLTMFGVDQWRQLPLRSAENAETYADFDMALLRRTVIDRAATYGGRCTILEGDSTAMVDAVLAYSLDFVFIDGDHTALGVERDIRAWLPTIKPGGMLLGHDAHWTTVRSVVNRMCPGWVDYGEAVWGVPVEAVLL